MKSVKRCVCGLAICILSLMSQAAFSQSKQVQVVGMTGDKDAVWIATSDNRLIYCWWPSDPKRLDKQANCRVLDKFGVDRLQ